MSRLAKASRECILTRQPPKPRQNGHGINDDRGAVHQSLEAYPLSNLNSQRSGLTSEEEKAVLYSPSVIQIGAARLVQELFESLKTLDEIEGPSINQLESTLAVPQHPQPSMTDFILPPKQKNYLSKISTNIASESPREDSLDALVSEDPGTISLEDYLHRIFEWGKFEDDIALVAFILIRRAVINKRRLRAKHLHKLVAGCILLAHKYLSDDFYWGFAEFGYLSGIKPWRVEKIEEALLFEVFDFQLYISDQELNKATQMLKK